MFWNRKSRRAFVSRTPKVRKVPPALRYSPQIVRPIGEPFPRELPEPYESIAPRDSMLDLAHAEEAFAASQHLEGPPGFEVFHYPEPAAFEPPQFHHEQPQFPEPHHFAPIEHQPEPMQEPAPLPPGPADHPPGG
jgi:hypothetical protein